MAQIVGLKGNQVSIGTDDGKIVDVPIAALQFANPQVGEEVKFFQNDKNTIVMRPDDSATEGAKKSDKVAYLLFTFFLGAVGVHRFIRGQVGVGILYILTFGACGVAVLIDFIIALTKLGKYKKDFVFDVAGNWTK